MDSIEIFRPIFAYALHLAQANPNRNRWSASPDAVRHDLASLLAAARAALPADGDDGVESAWYAVYSWLDEVLQNVPGGARIAGDLLPSLDRNGAEFYCRLNHLLTPGDDERISPETVDIIRVYSLCLELDYRGYYARPGHEHQRQAYRRRCRQAVEAALPPPAPEAEPPRRLFARTALVKAAVWVVPVVGTLILYGVYRSVLKNLYESIVGT